MIAVVCDVDPVSQARSVAAYGIFGGISGRRLHILKSERGFRGAVIPAECSPFLFLRGHSGQRHVAALRYNDHERVGISPAAYGDVGAERLHVDAERHFLLAPSLRDEHAGYLTARSHVGHGDG